MHRGKSHKRGTRHYRMTRRNHGGRKKTYRKRIYRGGYGSNTAINPFRDPIPSALPDPVPVPGVPMK
jgi:hypothetical protein